MTKYGNEAVLDAARCYGRTVAMMLAYLNADVEMQVVVDAFVEATLQQLQETTEALDEAAGEDRFVDELKRMLKGLGR